MKPRHVLAAPRGREGEVGDADQFLPTFLMSTGLNGLPSASVKESTDHVVWCARSGLPVDVTLTPAQSSGTQFRQPAPQFDTVAHALPGGNDPEWHAGTCMPVTVHVGGVCPRPVARVCPRPAAGGKNPASGMVC